MVRLVERLELNVVTGFLGSGKTTLLKRFIQSQDPESFLVIINEHGRESIDDQITLHLSSEIETIADGCLCCTVLDQFQQTLLQVLTRRARGELPKLKRIIVETSGLADPAPILGTILSDENLDEYIRIGPCITTFDALEGIDSLKRFPEAAAQLAAADRVALTKTDLTDQESISQLTAAVRSVNPACTIMTTDTPGTLFAPGESTAITEFVPETETVQHSHTSSVRSFSVSLDDSLDWGTFSVWLTALLNRHGDQILRFKSVLAVHSAPGKLVVQGVRHRVFPPSHLPKDDGNDKFSRLVFITDGLEKKSILDSLHQLIECKMLDPGFNRLTFQ